MQCLRYSFCFLSMCCCFLVNEIRPGIGPVLEAGLVLSAPAPFSVSVYT